MPEKVLCPVSHAVYEKLGNYKLKDAPKKHNRLLVRPVTGATRLSTYDLPPAHVAFGRPNAYQEENVQKALKDWQHHEKSKPTPKPVNYSKVNKVLLSSSSAGNLRSPSPNKQSPNTQVSPNRAVFNRSFFKEVKKNVHAEQVSNQVKVYEKRESEPLPGAKHQVLPSNHVFGAKSKLGDSVAALLKNDFLIQAVIGQEKKRSKVKHRKTNFFPKARPTRASLGQHRDTSTKAPKIFKLKEFQQVGCRVVVPPPNAKYVRLNRSRSTNAMRSKPAAVEDVGPNAASSAQQQMAAETAAALADELARNAQEAGGGRNVDPANKSQRHSIAGKIGPPPSYDSHYDSHVFGNLERRDNTQTSIIRLSTDMQC